MLAIDYAWSHPNPGAIRRAGYKGVIRYLSPDATKNITRDEVTALHRAGLWIALVWEGPSNAAGKGERQGRRDMRRAERMAARLGYPRDCPIFYAVDFDAEPRAIRPYFRGVTNGNRFQQGVYGSLRVVHDIMVTTGLVRYGWQTVAWSGGQTSSHAHLYQRGAPTVTITDTHGGYDEDVVMHPFPAWGPVKPASPKPKPSEPSPSADRDLVAAFDRWRQARGLTG